MPPQCLIGPYPVCHAKNGEFVTLREPDAPLSLSLVRDFIDSSIDCYVSNLETLVQGRSIRQIENLSAQVLDVSLELVENSLMGASLRSSELAAMGKTLAHSSDYARKVKLVRWYHALDSRCQ